jgi:hypothetical protein
LAAGLTSAVSTAGMMLCFSRSASNSPDWCTVRNRERRSVRDAEKARTAEDDVTPAHELAVHIQLRHRRPLPAHPLHQHPPCRLYRSHARVLLDVRAELLVLQDVERADLRLRDVVHLEHLHRRAREPALRLREVALHEQHHWRAAYRAVERRARLAREPPRGRGPERAGAERRRELYR